VRWLPINPAPPVTSTWAVIFELSLELSSSSWSSLQWLLLAARETVY